MSDKATHTHLYAADGATAAGRVAAAFVILAGAGYAVLAAVSGHTGAASDAVDVFLAGAVPGVLATLILWMSRPTRFGRALRGQMIVVSLAAPAVVACLPNLIAGH